MLLSKQSRFALLVAISGAVLLVFAKTALHPSQPNSTLSTYTFPATVPLTGWQAVESRPVERSSLTPLNDRAGNRYRYTQQQIELEIEIRYIVGTDGDIKKFIAQYIKPAQPLNQLQWETRQTQTGGSYALFVDQGNVYLSSCINPYGESTVTDREFKYNRNFYDIRYRLLPWLLGKSLKDERCLWTIASTPLQNTTPESLYPLLEQVWVEWNEWWRLHFPAAE
jgi:cyanosortase A-associated protein